MLKVCLDKTEGDLANTFSFTLTISNSNSSSSSIAANIPIIVYLKIPFLDYDYPIITLTGTTVKISDDSNIPDCITFSTDPSLVLHVDCDDESDVRSYSILTVSTFIATGK